MSVGPVSSNTDLYAFSTGYFSAGNASSRSVSKSADQTSASNSASDANQKTDEAQKDGKEEKSSNKSSSGVSKELTPEQQKQVAELKTTDQKVRAHEQAHVSAGGQYVRGGANFQYQAGPDGKRYAVAGEVSIDTSPEKEPAATIGKMQVVRRAALAPADPSAQDRSVAAAAAQKELEARGQLAEQQREEAAGKTEAAKSSDDAAKSAEGSSSAASGSSRAYGPNGARTSDANQIETPSLDLYA